LETAVLIVLVVIVAVVLLVGALAAGFGGGFGRPTVVRRTIIRRPARRVVLEEPTVTRRVYEDDAL
jgi:hypothetical protein